jgi:hypothetical protein
VDEAFEPYGAMIVPALKATPMLRAVGDTARVRD